MNLPWYYLIGVCVSISFLLVGIRFILPALVKDIATLLRKLRTPLLLLALLSLACGMAIK